MGPSESGGNRRLHVFVTVCVYSGHRERTASKTFPQNPHTISNTQSNQFSPQIPPHTQLMKTRSNDGLTSLLLVAIETIPSLQLQSVGTGVPDTHTHKKSHKYMKSPNFHPIPSVPRRFQAA